MPAHLKEWIDIVRTINTAKNAIERYSRLFELQHYLRVLYHRHESALRMRKASLNQAFASFFGVSDATIEKDLAYISERLGEQWHLTGTSPSLENS